MGTVVDEGIVKSQRGMPKRVPKIAPDNSEKSGAEPIYLTTIEVARRLHCPAGQVRKLRAKGDIEGHLQQDGTYLYDEDEIMTLVVSDAHDAAAGAEVALAGQEQAQAHVAKILDLATEPIKHTLKAQENMIESLLRRNGELEDRLNKAFDVVESARSKEHERKLELLEAESSDRTAERALETIKAALPFFAPAVAKKLDSILTGQKPKLGDGAPDLLELNSSAALLIANIPDAMYATIESMRVSWRWPSDDDMVLMQDIRAKVAALKKENEKSDGS